MPVEYSFYKLNAAGIVDSAARCMLNDDEAALAHARDLRAPVRVEVWARDRKVGVAPPAKLRRAG